MFDIVTKFENQIAEFYGAPYAVATDSCTHGIEICLRQQKVKKIRGCKFLIRFTLHN